jgi:uncharacterized protein (TIGR03382 family)
MVRLFRPLCAARESRPIPSVAQVASILAVGVALLGSEFETHAQAAAQDAGPPPDAHGEAESLVQSGKVLFRQANYARALEAFEQAYARIPDPEYLGMAIVTADKLGRGHTLLRLAHEWRSVYRAEATTAKIAQTSEKGHAALREKATAIVERAAAETATVLVNLIGIDLVDPGQVVISKDAGANDLSQTDAGTALQWPEGIRATLDGEPIDLAHDNHFRVLAGEHHLRIEGPGYVSITETFVTPVGATKPIAVTLRKIGVLRDIPPAGGALPPPPPLRRGCGCGAPHDQSVASSLAWLGVAVTLAGRKRRKQ